MGRSTFGRKFIWMAAGGMLCTVAVVSPETFTKFFDDDPERDLPGPTVVAPASRHNPAVVLDPIDQAIAPVMRSREDSKEVMDLYGIETETEAAPEEAQGENPGNASFENADLPATPSEAVQEETALTADEENQTEISAEEDVHIAPEETLLSKRQDDDKPGATDKEADASSVLEGQLANEDRPLGVPEAEDVWSWEIAPGDSLDVILKKADILAKQRYEISSAISKKFNLGRLRPGNEVRVVRDQDGNVKGVEILLDKNSSVEAVIRDEIDVTIVKPAASRKTSASEITINGSIFTALGKQEIPTQFATDLANALSGHVDFRRDLQAGDTLELLWSQKRTEDGDVIGGSDISYGRLNARKRVYEVVWKEDGSRLVFRDGDVIRTFSSPVPGARISSNYGMRRHPVLGVRAMHEGTDFAAVTGTPVLATTAGVVSYVGRRGSYGRVVEIQHSPSVKTRYAHLSRYAAKKGDRVEAGERIGYIGSSGRVTGPHLHYEFLLNGRAVDPMAAGRWKSLEVSGSEREKLDSLKEARKEYLAKKSDDANKELVMLQ